MRTLPALVAIAVLAPAATAEAVYRPKMRGSLALFTGGPPCNRSQLDAFVFAYLPNLSEGQAQAVFDRYKPKPKTTATLLVGGRTYKLRPYPRDSYVRNDYVSWGFHPLKGVAASALGRKGTIRYASAGGAVKATVRVERGGCD